MECNISNGKHSVPQENQHSHNRQKHSSLKPMSLALDKLSVLLSKLSLLHFWPLSQQILRSQNVVSITCRPLKIHQTKDFKNRNKNSARTGIWKALKNTLRVSLTFNINMKYNYKILDFICNNTLITQTAQPCILRISNVYYQTSCNASIHDLL